MQKIVLITGVAGQDGSYPANLLLEKSNIVHQILRLGTAAFRRQRKAGRREGEKHSCLTSRLGGCALTAMAEPLVTSRITPDCWQMVRMAAAKTGGKQDEGWPRLLEAEMKRVSLTAGRC